MITTLHIKNIGIIEDITVDFNEGFNALTGETGAGKTLIVDSLNIIAGGRFSKEMIRKGETYSFVEVALFLPNLEEENYIVSREIHSNGRSTCKINGHLVTVNELKNFMLNVINIHGQSDNQTIMNINEHINFLDDFIGKDIINLKEEYLTLYNEYKEIQNELSKNYGDDTEKERKLDLLNYQLNEISEANLQINEDLELEEQRKIIQNSEKIYTNLKVAENNNEIALEEYLITSIKAMEKIENLNEEYSKKLENLRDIYYNLEEINRDISNMQNSIDFDEETQNNIEYRLDLISSLKRKYGASVEDILSYKEKLQDEIKSIENLETYILELKEKEKILVEKLKNIATEINKIRVKSALELEGKINKELKDLEMKNAKFKVKIVYNENIFKPTGSDDVEFLISTNIGEDYKPLIKIASGGEMSRIMLAIKTIFADTDKVATMVFDEIDTGISGIAAKSVAEKMSKIAEKHQIFVVTHLAIIAAYAKNNYYISKNTENNYTKTNIRLLNEAETVNEIARILTGDITETAITHAKELRKKCA